jgi:hypothetical protein
MAPYFLWHDRNKEKRDRITSAAIILTFSIQSPSNLYIIFFKA